MLLLVVVITGMRQHQYDIKKIIKRAIGIVYSLFFLTVVLILTAAITESKPASAISPIGVSAGTGAGGFLSGHSSNGSLSALFAVPDILYGPGGK